MNAFEKLMRAPSYSTHISQSSALSGGCVQRSPYCYTAPPDLIPVSNSKEAFAESLGLGLPKVEAKKESQEEAPIPRYFSPRREDCYAELASLSSKDS